MLEHVTIAFMGSRGISTLELFERGRPNPQIVDGEVDRQAQSPNPVRNSVLGVSPTAQVMNFTCLGGPDCWQELINFRGQPQSRSPDDQRISAVPRGQIESSAAPTLSVRQPSAGRFQVLATETSSSSIINS